MLPHVIATSPSWSSNVLWGTQGESLGIPMGSLGLPSSELCKNVIFAGENITEPNPKSGLES